MKWEWALSFEQWTRDVTDLMRSYNGFLGMISIPPEVIYTYLVLIYLIVLIDHVLCDSGVRLDTMVLLSRCRRRWMGIPT